ncbi:uncharacterized protein K02A2.6-like [Corticium candelabrum]|uniref:uncharacterized protein K02A2.6-like n=1 Tax=Corticium candelabrum TaxID=121492 RepID=UPI002E25ED3C|nr:uncharacterized protein K02A2.6-like [Corticium candelabrum]
MFVNISDDVIAYGKTRQEHDKWLERVLRRFEDKGLTLNPAKCEFALKKIDFMGHIISQEDHKPLEVIYRKHSKPSPRIERWVLRLQSYDSDIVYQSGKTNIAGPLSRPPTQSSSGEADEYVKFVAIAATPSSLTTREIEKESSRDEELTRVRNAIRSGQSRAMAEEYRHLFGELATIGYIILRECHIVIPRRLRHRVLALAYEGHQDIAKCKARLQSKVWWPEVDGDIERACRTCRECQITQLDNQAPPMTRTTLQSAPWVSIAADMQGPLPTGEHLLIVVDYYSRFYEVEIMCSTRAQDVI